MAEHWCKEHKQPFFKKGKMKGFAHPILDDDGEPTGEWCNEPDGEASAGKASGRSYGKSDEELIQIRQTEEAKRRSIEAQVALKGAIDLAVAIVNQGSEYIAEALGKIEPNARGFYQLLQSLTLISEAQVIHQAFKGVEIVKTTEKVPDKEAVSEHTRVDDSGGGVKNAGELMKWAVGHGKEFGPSWVKREALLGDGEITEEVAQTAYQHIKAKMGW